MTHNYGTITVDARSERISNGDCRYDIVGHATISLKGRNYFKYLEVVYQNRTFFGLVPKNVVIDDLFFDGIMTINTRLYGVCISYGENLVAECCLKSIFDDPKIIQKAKAAYYNEILSELGVDVIDNGIEHVDTVLESLRHQKILQDNNILGMLRTIDELQLKNAKLVERNQQLSKEVTEQNQTIMRHSEDNKKLQEQVDKLTEERTTFKEQLTDSIIALIGKLK